MGTLAVLHTRTFHRRFKDCIARGPKSLVIVSPFVTNIPPWRSTAEFCAFLFKRGVTGLIIVTRPPDGSNGCLTKVDADQLESSGVDLRIRTDPDLHSKVYYFQYDEQTYAAFIGSANFTKGGFVDNDETMAMIQNLDDHSEVQREVTRLTAFGAYPYSHWKTRRKI